MTLNEAQFAALVAKIDPAATFLRAWPLTGGVSAQVTALELEAPDGTRRTYVVRQHGDGDLADNPDIARDEFRLLTVLQNAGVAAPAQIYVDNAGDVLGSPCIVIAFIDGAPDFTPADPIGLVGQFAAHLAQIHTIDGASLDIAFLPDRAARVAEMLRQRPAVLDESLQEGRIRDALARVWPLQARNPSVLLHGDYWPGNILCKEGRVAAIIDWEDAQRGDPLADVANARLEMLWAYGTDAMHAFTLQYLALTHADTAHLPHWDLVAALRPAGKLSTWALNADAEQRMRTRHAEFVAQAFAALS